MKCFHSSKPGPAHPLFLECAEGPVAPSQVDAMGRNCLHMKKSKCVVWWVRDMAWHMDELDVRKVSKHDKVRESKVRKLILGTVGERRVGDAQALVDRA